MANPATKIIPFATGVARSPSPPKILRSVRQEDPVSVDNPLLGTALRNHYRIDRELGRGGMATVYLSHDLKHDRPVALKVLHANVAAMLGPERFLREIKLAARLQHPHILPVFDSGEADGQLWYTMPFVAGESVRNLLDREGRLSLDETIRIADQVADALEHAHRQGIVHRDVKPENMLISESHAWLADFGVAQAAKSTSDRLTEAGMVVGTPAYMSPEQATAESDLDGRSDVYALGCVLYEMLTGKQPYRGRTPAAVLAQQLTGPVPSIRAIRADLPPWIDFVVTKTLSKSPADRFASAAGLAAALMAPRTTGVAPPASADKSIAVLPFANLSADPENEFFADGMTDEVINALAKVPGLRVVSRTSAFAFKGKQLDVREIGAQLNVQAVVEGSVRRSGRRLRLSAHLTNIADGYQLWSDSFDRELEDVFAVQDELSRGIVSALQIRLLGSQRSALVRPPTDDLEAYTLYLKGRHFWNRRSEPDLWRGLEYFQQALARDPGYAPAHAGVADSYAILGFYSALRPTDAFPQARQSGVRALELDPGLGEAHPALAYVAMYHDWDWAAAEQEFQLAIRLSPGYSTTHQWYGNFLAVMGRFDESVSEFSRAIALDPLSPLKSAALAWSYYFARRYDLAVAQCLRALELDAELAVAHAWHGLALEQQKALPEATAAFRAAVRCSGRNVGFLAGLARVHAVAGHAEAHTLLAELIELRNSRYVSAYDVALIHLALGEAGAAMEMLETAYAERAHSMAFMGVDPRLDLLRAEARFERLQARLRFPSSMTAIA
jgi:serine/threonine-protein kinase